MSCGGWRIQHTRITRKKNLRQNPSPDTYLSCSCLDRILPLWEVDVLFALLQCLQRLLVLSHRFISPSISQVPNNNMIMIITSTRTTTTTKRNYTHLGESTPDCACLLWSEVKRCILLLLVVLPQVLARLLVRDGHHPSNGFADRVALPPN